MVHAGDRSCDACENCKLGKMTPRPGHVRFLTFFGVYVSLGQRLFLCELDLSRRRERVHRRTVRAVGS